MNKYQIFVSSTYEDLKEERDAVIKAILEMGHIPVGMEMFSAADEEQWKVITKHVLESDYYVVIVAHRYGSTTRGVSYTEKEYDFAVSHGIPTLGFVIDEAAAWPNNRREDAALQKIRKFKAKIKRRLVAFWTSAEDLSGKVTRSLVKQFAVTPRPGWARATEAIDPSVVNEMSRLSEENRRLREDIEKLRIMEQSVQPPGLDQSISLAVEIFKRSNNVQRERVGAERFEVTWLEILRKVGPELITEPTPEIQIFFLIEGSVSARVENKNNFVVRLAEESFRATKIDLVGRGIVEVERDERRELVWRLTPAGRIFLFSKRELLLEEAVNNLRVLGVDS